jgi:hypothetical protein
MLAASLASAGPVWAFDICRASDVKEILDDLSTEEVFLDCKMQKISQRYTDASESLLQAVSLLTPLYAAPPADDDDPDGEENISDPEGEEPDPPRLSDEVERARAEVTEISNVAWETEQAAAESETRMQTANDQVQQLIGRISGYSPDEVESDLRLTFCKAMLEWKTSQHWHQRFTDCMAAE